MLIIDILFYNDFGEKKRVVFYYREFWGNESICRLECDNDFVCNVYFFDCFCCFLSSCDVFKDVFGCVLCVFLIKVINLSSVNCLEELLLLIYIIFCVCVCKDVNEIMEEVIERRWNKLFLNKIKFLFVIRKLIFV